MDTSEEFEEEVAAAAGHSLVACHPGRFIEIDGHMWVEMATYDTGIQSTTYNLRRSMSLQGGGAGPPPREPAPPPEGQRQHQSHFPPRDVELLDSRVFWTLFGL